MSRAFALALAATLAAGCTPIGQDFLRPDEASVRLGETTVEEVRSRYGAPRNERSWGRSDAPLAAEVGAPFGAAQVSGVMRELYYYHENRMGEAAVAGVEPSKSVRFWFFDERLVGYLAHSSFRGDSTGFDEAKASAIVPWRTRREEVVAALGPPSGIRAYPMVRTRGEEMLSYFSFEFDRAANQSRTKYFHVLVNMLGLVEDTRIGSSAKPIPPPPTPSVITVPVYTPPRRR